jgi:hypothetical protein
MAVEAPFIPHRISVADDTAQTTIEQSAMKARIQSRAKGLGLSLLNIKKEQKQE